MKNTITKTIDVDFYSSNQKTSLNSFDFIALATQYVSNQKAIDKNQSKLGSVSLYNTPDFTKEEQEKILQYARVLAYQERQEQELMKSQGLKIDDNGMRLDNNGLLFEKLINLDQFTTNTISKIFDLELDKIENKKILNNGVELWTSQSLLDSFGPAYNLQVQEQEKKIESNGQLIEKLKNKVQINKKNKNQSRNKQVFLELQATLN